MAAEKEIIVALELATSSIRAIAGHRMPDGTMQVKAIAEENSTNCIRKGIIDNIDKTTQAISRVLGQISLQLGQTVTRVYVGLAGQSLHTVLNPVQRTFTEKTQVTNDMIDQIMDANSGVVYTDSQILEVIPQEYKIGSRAVPEVVGMQVEQLEARFLNVVARETLSENIIKCVRGAHVDVAELLIAPLNLTDTLLNASEKRSGAALVDIGADTTTVGIYTNNILRKLVVIPLGGNNVTTDLATCLQTEFEEAESLKLRWGRAWLEDREKAKTNEIKLSHDRAIDEETLCDIVEARYEEILMNVWSQIKSDSEKLTSGIVFVGGGSQIPGLADAIQHFAHTTKPIRIAKGLPTDITTVPTHQIADNGRMYTIISLLLHGDQNCVRAKSEPEPVVPEAEINTPETTMDLTKTMEQSEANDEPKDPKANKIKKTGKSIWQIIKDSLTTDEDE